MNISSDIKQETNNAKKLTYEDFDYEVSSELLEKLSDKADDYSEKILADKEVMRRLHEFAITRKDLLSIYLVLKRTESIVNYLKYMRDKSNNNITINLTDEEIQKNITRDLPSLDDLDL